MRLVRYIHPAFRAFQPFNGFRRSPWSGFEAEIDRLFETVVTDFDRSPRAFAVDLYEDKGSTYVRAELPGVNRDDITVEMTDGELTITATRKTPATDGKPEESSSFRRSVSIVEEVQADKVEAAYANGVLTVTLPKREEAKPRKINVAVK